MSEKVLETLGLSKSKALETVRRFRAHDEATMAKQQAGKDDENKFLQTTRECAGQLLHLFETDAAEEQETPLKCRAAGAQCGVASTVAAKPSKLMRWRRRDVPL